MSPAPLPSDLLQAVSSLSGGKLALVLGAGCSFEAPTGIPTARACSREVHRRLIEDSVLTASDCSDPEDLSALTDAVFARTSSQTDVVRRLLDSFDLKAPTPNDGYLCAAALLTEGALSAVVTLNFDLAMTVAIAQLGSGQVVGIVQCPQDLADQKVVNIFYLHRNVNADAESWILRSVSLETEWRDHWEPIVATKVLTTPVVVFAGLGTPVGVLIESTKLLRKALPGVTKVYQVDPVAPSDSAFFQALELDSSAYIQRGWCAFMEALSGRLLEEHLAAISREAASMTQQNAWQAEDLTALLSPLRALGLVFVGRLRSTWLLQGKAYSRHEAGTVGLISDLLLGLAMMARISAAAIGITDDGTVEFSRGDRVVAAFLLASGRGQLSRSAIEARVSGSSRRGQGRSIQPRGVIVAGSIDDWNIPSTPPMDVVHGDESNDILSGSCALPMFHVHELRATPARVQGLVP